MQSAPALPASQPESSDVRDHARAYVNAVIAGSSDTVAAFCARSMPGRTKAELRAVAEQIEAALRDLSFRTCRQHGIDVRTFANFRRLRP